MNTDARPGVSPGKLFQGQGTTTILTLMSLLLRLDTFSQRRQYGWSTEKAQQIAAHESPRTTKLYDRTSDEVSLDEIEKIII